MYPRDTFNVQEATRLANTIKRYWAKQGKIVNTRLEPLEAMKYQDEHGRSGTVKGYVVRSDMVDGYPTMAAVAEAA